MASMRSALHDAFRACAGHSRSTAEGPCMKPHFLKYRSSRVAAKRSMWFAEVITTAGHWRPSGTDDHSIGAQATGRTGNNATKHGDVLSARHPRDWHAVCKSRGQCGKLLASSEWVCDHSGSLGPPGQQSKSSLRDAPLRWPAGGPPLHSRPGFQQQCGFSISLFGNSSPVNGSVAHAPMMLVRSRLYAPTHSLKNQ